MSTTHRTPVRRLAGRVRARLRRQRSAKAHRASVALASASTAQAAGPGERLVPSPVFVFSSMRSGSTLLRSLLDTHPQITAPHEMHLGEIKLGHRTRGVTEAQDALGLTENELLILLWDRVLHRQLHQSGKSMIVDKTPHNTLDWKRIEKGWPAARYIVLLRHPEQIARSMITARPDLPVEKHYRVVNDYARKLHAARRNLDAVVVRYEDLTANPARETKRMCKYLGVEWDERMLDYGASGNVYVRSLGDWSKNIRSGKVQPAAPLPAPEDVPEELRAACALLGY